MFGRTETAPKWLNDFLKSLQCGSIKTSETLAKKVLGFMSSSALTMTAAAPTIVVAAERKSAKYLGPCCKPAMAFSRQRAT
jgi:hypothetical protein